MGSHCPLPCHEACLLTPLPRVSLRRGIVRRPAIRLALAARRVVPPLATMLTFGAMLRPVLKWNSTTEKHLDAMQPDTTSEAVCAELAGAADVLPRARAQSCWPPRGGLGGARSLSVRHSGPKLIAARRTYSDGGKGGNPKSGFGRWRRGKIRTC